MALLLERVDTHTIILVGRWRNNVMLCYLHISAQTFTAVIVECRVQNRNYALIPPAHEV